MCKLQKVKELHHLNKVLFEDLILLVDHKSKTRKFTFWLIKNCKNNEFSESNCDLVWMHLIKKYATKLVPLSFTPGEKA